MPFTTLEVVADHGRIEREGVDKFAASWGMLHDRVQRMLDKARS